MSIDTTNPYVGLRPFHAEESLLFFGRHEQTLELLQRLHEHNFVAVVGSSGCGKSSLLKAGLIPALKGGYLVDDSDKWLIAVMKPGKSPVYYLAESILHQIDSNIKISEIKKFVTRIEEEGVDAILDLVTPLHNKEKTNFFLLVDQFEELFRFSMDGKDASREDEAIDFVNIILELSLQKIIPFYVVFTMRSDFIGDCAQFHDLPEAMNKSQYLVPRLNRRQLKMVIEGPARLYGGKFNSNLTSKLLNDLGKVKDELPLLQHALMRIWHYEMQTDKSGELDIEDYNKIGGIENALSQHADEALDDMNEKEVEMSKDIFKALTDIDESGRKIRRPVLYSELKELTGATEKQLDTVIDHFIKDKRSFLILGNVGDTNEKIIDISHESLIRQWDTLGEWVDEEAEFANNYKQLDEARRLHDAQKKDLLSGSELHLALDWFNKFQPKAVWANRYKEGFEESQTYLLNSEKQDKHLQKRKRVYLYGFITILILIIGFSAWYGLRESNRNSAFNLHFAAQNVLDKDPTLALQGEILAFEKFSDSAFFIAQKDIYNKNSIYNITGRISNKKIAFFETDDNGNLIIAVDSVGGATIYNKTGEVKYQFKLPNDSLNIKKPDDALNRITAITFIDNNEKVLIGGYNGSLYRYDMNDKKWEAIYNRRIIDTIIGDSIIVKLETIRSVTTVNKTIKFYTGSGLVQSTDGKNWKKYRFTQPIAGIEFSGSGEMAIFTSNYFTIGDLKNLKNKQYNSYLKYLDKNSAEEINGSKITSEFSDNRNKLLIGYLENSAAIWDQTTKELTPFKGQRDAVNFVSFVPTNNDYFFIGTNDNVLSLLDTNGVLVQEFIGHTDRIYHIQMGNNNTVESYSYDGTIRKWKIKEAMNVSKSLFEDSKIEQVIWSYDDNEVIARDFKSMRKWNLGVETQEIDSLFPSHSELGYDYISALVMAPDRQSFFVGNYSLTAYLFDRNGQKSAKFKHENAGYARLSAASISQDGGLIVTAFENDVYLWDKEGNLIKKYSGHSSRVRSVVISPDNKFIISGSEDNTTKLWSTAGKNSVLWSIPSKNVVSSVAFSPSGNKIITGSFDKRVFHINANDPDSIMQLYGNEDSVVQVIFGEKHIVAIYRNGTAVIWDANRFGIIKELNDNSYRIQCASLNPITNQLVTGDDNGLIRFWDLNPSMSLEEFLKNNGLDMSGDYDEIEMSSEDYIIHKLNNFENK